MKTEELIQALAAAGSRPVLSIAQVLFRALGLGVVASIALFLAILRPRPDFAQALFAWPFVLKLLVAMSVTTTASLLLADTSRPVAMFRWRWLLAFAPLLLAGGIMVELWTVPSQTWARHLIGHSAPRCLSRILMLSFPPVVCLLVALRRGAPMHPSLAGATAGLVSGGVGALLYALTCRDDSPLFVATWYSIAIGIVTGMSAYVGSRILRW
jgi:hypothetical protein